MSTRAAEFADGRALARLADTTDDGSHYRFDDHLDDAQALRRADPTHTGPAALGIEFADADPIDLRPLRSPHRREDGLLKIHHHAGDYLASHGALSLARDGAARIELRMRVDHGTQMELAWSSDPDAAWHGRQLGSVRVDTMPDGRFHTYVIDATGLFRDRRRATDAIRRFFLRPSNAPGDAVELDYFRVVPTHAIYAAAPYGAAYETIAGEMRRVVYANTPSRLRFTVRVPDEAPELAFGAAVLRHGAAVRFRVSLTSSGEARVLHDRTENGGAGWSDVRVRLDRWAGRIVQLDLEAEAEDGNVAFWSNPMLHGTPAERLDVVLVLEDTLRADHLSAYGHVRQTSPAKDRLAAGGVLFEYALAGDEDPALVPEPHDRSLPHGDRGVGTSGAAR